MKRTERIEVYLSVDERRELDKARDLVPLATWIRAKVLAVARREEKRKKGGGRG